MKLSTFAKLVSAEWNRNNKSFEYVYNEYICITADSVTNELKRKTNNPKLQEQYDSHYKKYVKRVDYMIKGCGTVIAFLIDYKNDYFHSFNCYREAKWRYRKEIILPQLIGYFKSIEELSPILKGESPKS